MFLDPAIGKDFFDRRDILDLLKKRADGLRYGYRQNVAIIGPPYYGKTSIIYHFINNMPFKDIVPIYVEVKPQGFLNFADRFISALLFQYLNATEYRMEPTTELIPIAAERLPKTTKAIKEIEAFIKNDNHSKAYPALLELPATAYAETNLRPVIIMDEFHRIEDFGIEDVFSTLGKYIMFQKDAMYIVTSSDTNRAKKILSEKLSLLFGNFEVYELKIFDVLTAAAFINFKLKPNAIPEDLKFFLVAFTDGHPFYLDCILPKLNEYLSSSTEADPVEIITRLFEELLFDSKGILNQHFSSYVSDLERVGQRQISVLLSISNGNRKLQSLVSSLHLKPHELRPLLQELTNLGYVVKYGVFYVIRDKVFEFWLKNVYQSKEYRLSLDYESKISKFKNEIQKYIESFLNASNRNHLEVLAELFGSFNRELVWLDNRYFIFPAFKKTAIYNTERDGICYLILSDDKCSWAFLIGLCPLADEAVADFLDYSRKYKKALKKKVIISPAEMDTNTKLLAKRARISIWTSTQLNELFDIAGKQRMILPEFSQAPSITGQDLDVTHSETA